MKQIVATYLILILSITGLLFACPSCKLFQSGLAPSEVTEQAGEFLPTAVNICNRLKAYAPDDPNVQGACDEILTLLEDPEREIRVVALDDLLWLIPLHNDFVREDPDTSDSYAVTADALKRALEIYLEVPSDGE